MNNHYKATLYSLDCEVEIEGLSMFSKNHRHRIIFYILYLNYEKVLVLEKEG